MKKDVSYFTQQIKRAKTEKDRLSREYEWKNLKDTINTAGLYVEMGADSPKQVEAPHTSAGYVNWPWAFKESFIPAVYTKQPEIYVYPKRSMYAQNAHLVQANTNAALNAVGISREVKRMLLDCLVFGHAWLKIGWFTRFGQLPRGAGTTVDEKISTLDMDMDMIIDMPYAYRLAPKLVHVDPEADRYEDIRWIAQEYYQPYDDIQKDPFLRYTKDASALSYGEENEIPSLFDKQGTEAKKRQWARIYEIWDRESEKVLVLCDGCDKFSRVVTSFPYSNIRGFPFKYLTLTEAVDKFYPPSPILAWLPMVNELGFIRATRMEHMQKMINKIINEENNIDEEELKKAQDPECEYFEVRDIEKIKDFRGLQPDPNLYASEERIESTIRDISGFSELISGSVPYSKLTATTSQIAAQHSTIRFQHATQIVSEFIREVAQDLFFIVKDYQEYPVSVRISDDPNAALQDITREQLDGEFDFRVLIEDMSHISKAERVKGAYDELIALSPFKEVRRETLIRKFLEANGHININEFMYPPMGPPVDPMYENSLMARGVPVQVNPREDHELHLRVHNEWISSPAYQQLVAQMPAVQQLVSAHIQETNRAYEEYRGEAGENARQRPGVTAQTQQGRQLASSTPQGGARNQQGPQEGVRGIIEALRARGGV
jgi:hypothetical protein